MRPRRPCMPDREWEQWRDRGGFDPPSGMVRALDGCEIAYRWDGPVEDPVLLLSNSLGARMDMWAPQLEAFANRFLVLRYDGRGHVLRGSLQAAIHSIVWVWTCWRCWMHSI